jgi:hypothetical protein
MLPGMSRLFVIALGLATAACSSCSNPAGSQDKGTASPPVEGGKKIAVPGGDRNIGAPGGPVDDPKNHLHPDEGTLTIDKAAAKPGAEATAGIKVVPATGYHLSTDYPIKLTLEAPDGVKLAKTELTAGGRDKAQGDATTLSEKLVEFAVKATADKPGAYEIKGMFKFGVCDDQACHPKRQPITIAVAAQ